MEDRVEFPWFPMCSEPDELKAYMHFVTALCEMSKNQKRITAKEKTVDNEKYALTIITDPSVFTCGNRM